MTSLKNKALVGVVALVLGALSFGTPAMADHHRRYYGGYAYRSYPRYYAPGYYRPGYYAPPVVYSRPYVDPYYYAPPVYYSPAPVVYSPPVYYDYYSSPVVYPSGFGFSYGSRHRSFSFGVGR